MGAFLAMLDPITKLLDRVIPDKAAAAEAKAQLIQLQTQGALANELAEIQGSVDVLKSEAASQSWLPRNVRPLLLLMWGSLVTMNFAIPIVARIWIHDLQPVPLDPWVYKLTAIGFTGYAGFRTWEKLMDKDT
jgi:hypothetical protein